ncbi:sensor histidine kinase, partial [Paraburkholderia bryophila]
GFQTDDEHAGSGRAASVGDDDSEELPPDEFDLASVPPLVVRGNPVLLREVIANLLDNALKYVPLARPEGARITLNVSQVTLGNGRAAAEIVVEDNGSGVPAGQQADLFKRFFRGDAQSGNGVETGAGLGLAIVHDIIAMHDGAVSYADAPEGGSRFIVRIPLAAKPAE